MRAIVMREHGGPEVLRLEELPEPAPGHGEAVVRVAAVAVNRLDIWVREDVGHAYGATLPIVRDRYLFAPNIEVHETPSVTGWLALGVGVRFP